MLEFGAFAKGYGEAGSFPSRDYSQIVGVGMTSKLRAPDQSEGRRFLRLLLRLAAVVGFLFYIVILGQGSLAASTLDRVPVWLRWALLFCLGCFGWWATSSFVKKPKKHGAETGDNLQIPSSKIQRSSKLE